MHLVHLTLNILLANESKFDELTESIDFGMLMTPPFWMGRSAMMEQMRGIIWNLALPTFRCASRSCNYINIVVNLNKFIIIKSNKDNI